MSKSRIAIVVVVLAVLLPSAAPGRGFGLPSPLGVVRSTFARLLPFGGLHRGHHGHVRSVARRSHDIRYAMSPQSSAGGLRGDNLLTDPAERVQIAAAAALAGWHGGQFRGADAWWSHGHGGYGWVGPLFWPFAYDDIYGYTIFGDRIAFWDYGYADIYAGIFGPYGHDDLDGYMAQPPRARRHGRLPTLAQFCGDDSREIAGVPIDQIQQAIQPSDAQRAALDELATASIQAAQIIRASCPTQTALTAPARLAAMGQRIEAMIKAELALQPPLEKLYDLLDDAQKARLDALGEDRRKTTATNGTRKASAQGCPAAQPAALQWPADEIDARLRPNETQRAAFEVLQDASARAFDMLNDVCQPDDAIKVSERLAALDRRLDAMQQAVRLVDDALEDLFATLGDEQKAQFEAIGPRRSA